MQIYSCKYSKRKYAQHQLMSLILLKEYLNTDYRSIVKFFDVVDKVQQRTQGVKSERKYMLSSVHSVFSVVMTGIQSF